MTTTTIREITITLRSLQCRWRWARAELCAHAWPWRAFFPSDEDAAGRPAGGGGDSSCSLVFAPAPRVFRNSHKHSHASTNTTHSHPHTLARRTLNKRHQW